RRRRAAYAVAAAAALLAAAVAVAVVVLARRPAPAWRPAIVELQPQVDEDSDAPSVSPDGRLLAFASDAEQPEHYRIYVQPIGGGPRRALTRPDQAIAHSSVRWARDGAAVLAIDTGHGNAIVRVPVAGGAQEVDFAGPAFGVDDCGGRLAVVAAPPDCPGCSALEVVAPGQPPRELAREAPGPRVGWLRCDPAGTRAVYVERAGYTMSADVWMISLADGARLRLTDDGANNLDPVFTADGRAVLFTSTRGGPANLWELPLAGGAPHPITTGAGPDLGPAPTPDGRRLLFDVDVTSVHLVAWQGGVRRALTTEVREIVSGPAASPDGVHLAAVRTDGAAPHIVLLDLRTGDLRVAADGDHAGFSPDARELVYTTLAPPRVVAMPVAGGVSRVLAELSGPVEGFAIGGDARVHLSLERERREAWSVGLAGGDLRRDGEPPVALVVPGPAGRRFELRCPDLRACEARVEPGEVSLPAVAGAWTSDGALYYCAHADLFRLDVRPGAAGVTTPLATGCRMGFALSPDGATIYTGEYSGHVRRMTITNFGER
ncbi:MAG TPA: hypothetical protein VHE35_03300, partial [Kofleriaceae bacterium]|nr:hypothetical protein [Kofleriaceae bacterium]